MDIVGIIAIGIIAALSSLFVKQYKPEFSAAVTTSASVVILVKIAESAMPIINNYFGVADDFFTNNIAFGIMFRALGISYLTVFAADICRDLGQAAIGSKIEIAGKFAIVILSFPMIKQIISFVSDIK